MNKEPGQRPDRELAAILRHYDSQMRVSHEPPGMRREESDCVVRLIDLRGKEGSIIYSRLQGRDVREVVRREIEYFKKLGQDFEWKVFAHDDPPELAELLQTMGFETEAREALMV